eukprot:s412_g12.t1
MPPLATVSLGGQMVMSGPSASSQQAVRSVHLEPDGRSPGLAPLQPSAADATRTHSLAEKLAAAKPVSWRGKGDIPQYSWSGPPLRGCWLVLDLWAGYSGLCITLLSLGVHFYALAAETDSTCRACAQAAMPNIVHTEAVEHVQVRMLRAVLKRRQFRGIIVGGGSPCQGNSSLNSARAGLGDKRSLQPSHLARLVQDLEDEPLCQGLEIVAFLENVASMPPDVRQQYDRWLRSSPVIINAASCGWVQRRRMYWLSCRGKGLHSALKPPRDWDWVPTSSQVPELRYCGKKPIPALVSWADGFTPLVDPSQVLKQGGVGAMHTFTREFFHPRDRIKQVSPAAAHRFELDNQRFPPGAYEEQSLVWKRDAWRTLHPDERAQLLGMPPAAVAAVKGPEATQTQVRNSLLGNGFHLPSLLAIFMLLPAILEAKLTLTPTAPDADLRARLQGSVWEPGRLESFPDMLDADYLISEMQHCFSAIPVSPDIWADVSRRLGHCQLQRMQAYMAWRRMRGEAWGSLGPTPLVARDRTRIFAGLTGQRYASSTSRGLDHLLPPGLGPQQHIAAALRQPSPFSPTEWPEPDVGFVVDTLVLWRNHLPGLAQSQRDALRSVARALGPLEQALQAHRSVGARHVASDKKPAFVSCLTALLRWPDTQQGRHLLLGYPIVGDVAPSGVFREVSQSEKLPIDDWLGDPAIEAVDRLLSSGPPRHAAEILSVTQEEQAKGFCGPFLTRAEVDDLYGRGRWRHLERFIIVQSCGKMRVIDNARKTGHNSHTSMSETISTTSVDFIASSARMVAQALCGSHHTPAAYLEWLQLRIGTDDLPDAYRGLPVCDDHLRYSMVAIHVPDLGWRFTTLWGLAYGLESAVVAFNRFPQLGIAITRRCLLGFASAYFDDELAVEFLRDVDVTQKGLQLAFSLMGATPQAAKSFAPTCNRHYLGTSVHTGDAFTTGFVRFQPKSTTSWKVCDRLRHICASASLDRDTAGKLRGDINWLWSMCAGYVGKLAGPVLTEKQTGSDPSLSPIQLWTLQLLQELLAQADPRDVWILGPIKANVVVYSDASFEDGALRLGWVIFHPQLPTVGGTCAVPQSTLASWAPRKQQIYPGETLCGLIVPLIHPDYFRQQDVVWYVDNEAATSSLVRGSSKQLDVHMIAQYSQVILYKLGARTWWEWIDSSSNPSDGLSRLGIHDPWTASQGWSIQEYQFPTQLLPASFLSSFAALVVASEDLTAYKLYELGVLCHNLAKLKSGGETVYSAMFGELAKRPAEVWEPKAVAQAGVLDAMRRRQMFSHPGLLVLLFQRFFSTLPSYSVHSLTQASWCLVELDALDHAEELHQELPPDEAPQGFPQARYAMRRVFERLQELDSQEPFTPTQRCHVQTLIRAYRYRHELDHGLLPPKVKSFCKAQFDVSSSVVSAVARA